MTQQAHDRSALDTLQEWDADWATKYRRMSTNPWTNGILSVKEIEPICTPPWKRSWKCASAACRRARKPATWPCRF